MATDCAQMFDPERPSKTQRKREMRELQQLGERLLTLNAAQLDATGLPETLRTAVAEAQGMPPGESRRRQQQYIGRLMRGIDPEPIRNKLSVWNGPSRERTASLHEIERWREKLIDDDAALGEFLRQRPGADSQRLRALIRNTRAERDAARPPKRYRELFRLLRDMIEVSQ